MDQILKKYSETQILKAQKIKALIFDVDGVLTDGKITYTEKGDETKAFNVKDGQIIKFLKQNQIVVGAITGRSSDIVARRCKELNLDFYYQGAETKREKLDEVKKNYDLKSEEIAYIGDDIIDLAIIKEVGLGATPRDALSYVADQADLVCTKNGGEGVVRELADFILAAKNRLQQVIDSHNK